VSTTPQDGPGPGEPLAVGAPGPRVYLRHPVAGDADEFAAAVRASRTLHAHWTTPPASRAAFLSYLERTAGPAYQAYLVRRRSDDALVGRANLSQIFHGALQGAYLGYEAFAPHAGRGYMTEGVGLVLREAFGPVGLHRVEANIQPDNAASKALARRLGFRLEGFSPRYLLIAGAWRDHERWALLADEWRGRPV
jgi:ribosomal-protein-alanine N-acetyltransferase